jgi:hypothetical protein
MPDSIERLVKGISVLRLLNIATFVMIAICIIVSASIALAEDVAEAPAAPRAAEQTFTEIDVYEFDFAVEAETQPNPEFDEPSDIEDI